MMLTNQRRKRKAFLNVFQSDSGATHEKGTPEEVPPTEANKP
jgi:hypothetical protein